MQHNVPAAFSYFAQYHSALIGFKNELKNEAAQTESEIWQQAVELVISETIDPVRSSESWLTSRLISVVMRCFSLSSCLTEADRVLGIVVFFSNRKCREGDPGYLWQEHEGV